MKNDVQSQKIIELRKCLDSTILTEDNLLNESVLKASIELDKLIVDFYQEHLEKH